MHMKSKAGARSIKKFTQKNFATAEEPHGANIIDVSAELLHGQERRNALTRERD